MSTKTPIFFRGNPPGPVDFHPGKGGESHESNQTETSQPKGQPSQPGSHSADYQTIQTPIQQTRSTQLLIPHRSTQLPIPHRTTQFPRPVSIQLHSGLGLLSGPPRLPAVDRDQTLGLRSVFPRGRLSPDRPNSRREAILLQPTNNTALRHPPQPAFHPQPGEPRSSTARLRTTVDATPIICISTNSRPTPEKDTPSCMTSPPSASSR
jgi:hypothetical protein